MTSTHLLSIGLILIAVGIVWFIRSLGLGGGSGSIVVLLIGITFCAAALIVHLRRAKR
jgi:hypothetical protein